MNEDNAPLSLSNWPCVQVKHMLRLAGLPFDHATHATFYKVAGRHHMVRYLLDLLKACHCVGWIGQPNGRWSEVVDRRSKGTIPRAYQDRKAARREWPGASDREIFRILASAKIQNRDWRPSETAAEETPTRLGVDPVTGLPYH